MIIVKELYLSNLIFMRPCFKYQNCRYHIWYESLIMETRGVISHWARFACGCKVIWDRLYTERSLNNDIIWYSSYQEVGSLSPIFKSGQICHSVINNRMRQEFLLCWCTICVWNSRPCKKSNTLRLPCWRDPVIGTFPTEITADSHHQLSSTVNEASWTKKVKWLF